MDGLTNVYMILYFYILLNAMHSIRQTISAGQNILLTCGRMLCSEALGSQSGLVTSDSTLNVAQGNPIIQATCEFFFSITQQTSHLGDRWWFCITP